MNTNNSDDNWKLLFWQSIIFLEGQTFRTSGRGKRPGVEFTFEISRTSKPGGRHYKGVSIEGFGNELWIIDSSTGARRSRSVSRSTVELGYTRAVELLSTTGTIKGPKALGIPGAGSYLYPVLLCVIGESDSVIIKQEDE